MMALVHAVGRRRGTHLQSGICSRSSVTLLSLRCCSILAVEMYGQEEQDGWVHNWGFRHEPSGLGSVVQMEYVAHRWDPWLYADRTGDRSLVEGPASRRYKVQGRRDWELGRDWDQCRVTVLPKATSQPTLAGIPVVAIESLLEIYVAEQGMEGTGVGAAEADVVESWEKGMMLGGQFPVVD